ADALGVEAHHDQPLLRFVDRQPLVRFHVLALQILEQVHRLDPVWLVGLVGHAEELGERRADRRDLDLEFLGQHLLDVDRFLARLARGELELARREHRVGDEVVVFGLDGRGLLALLEGDRQGLRKLDHALLGEHAEGRPRLVVDDLDHADQLGAAGLDDRRDQHLLGAIAGALVDLLQKAQVGVQRAQLAVVVDVLDVDHLLGERHEAGDRVLGDRQLQVLERIEPRLHLGHDRLLVLAHRVDGEAIGVEQCAHVRAHLEHDLVDVAGGVDLVRDRLQLLLERESRADIGARMTQHCAHRLPPRPPASSSFCDVSAIYPDSQRNSPQNCPVYALFSTVRRPPSRSHTLKPLWANRNAAAALRRPLWQYATYSLERSRTANMLRTSASGTLIAPGSLSYWYSEG